MNDPIEKLVKNYEVWYARRENLIDRKLSNRGFDLPWTHFLVIVRPQGVATIVTHLNILASKG